MFVDEAKITVEAGKGGAGCVSWRREKYVAKGGPDGGDGGRGGHVYIQADANTDTLSDYRSVKNFKAQTGGSGQGKNKHGKNGDDLLLVVPPGTLVQEDGEVLADLHAHGDEFLVVTGGRGGFGNAHFTSSVRQRPDFAEKGEEGQKKEVTLELKLVADVGIIGLPSVGKSTLISAVSAAKPKIAAYEFTTLVPNLGVVNVYDRSFVLCDVPGLIEDASEGKGLGHQFLKHIERCGVLIHVLDASRGTLQEDYKTIRTELEKYSKTLAEKKELIVINKIDIAKEYDASGLNIFAEISGAAHMGTEQLMQKLLPIVLEQRDKIAEPVEAEEKVVLKPHEENDRMNAYDIEKNAEGEVHVTGKRIEQFTAMTDFGADGAILRWKDVLEKIGLRRAINKLKEDDTTPIFIGKTQVDAYL